MIHTGDCVEVMAGMPEASVDAVCTDPPYGLEFMGKAWDSPLRNGWQAEPGRYHNDTNFLAKGDRIRYQAGPSFQAWCEAWGREALRVTKPGGYLLAFGSSRTHHRLFTGLEDAGWEIRDTLVWCFASGFPKSRNVSADLLAAVPEGARCACAPRSTRTALGSQDGYRPERGSGDGPPRPVEGSGLASAPSRGGVRGRSRGGPGADDPVLGLEHSPAPASSARPSTEDSPHPSPLQAAGSRASGTELSGKSSSTSDSEDGLEDGRSPARTPSIERSGDDLGAASWSPPRGDAFPYSKCTSCGGWKVAPGLGTALKPAAEYIVLARKPLAGNVAGNVAKHGTGALNIDATRIPGGGDAGWYDSTGNGPKFTGTAYNNGKVYEGKDTEPEPHQAGRWPSNLLLSDPELFDVANPGVVGSGAVTISGLMKAGTPEGRASVARNPMPESPMADDTYGDSGGYSRFFLIPKSARADREPVLRPEGHERGKRFSDHPTVKPTDLMRHLVRLVTPPGGTVLDCFLGSGSTAIACELEGFPWIGIEQDPGYVKIAEARLNGVQRGLGLDVPAPTRHTTTVPDSKRTTPSSQGLSRTRDDEIIWDSYTPSEGTG